MMIEPPRQSNDSGADESAGAARRVVLVRHLPGVVAECARTVHLTAAPETGEQPAAPAALCGAVLRPEETEVVRPGEGAPCTLCALGLAVSGPFDPAPAPSMGGASGGVDAFGAASPLEAVARYRSWDWPVTLRRNQVQLHLRHPPIAVLVPTALAASVSAVLVSRRCAPAVLAHPATPHHRVLLAGEQYPVSLPWPADTHRVTGAVLLPPSPTPRGPISWVRPPAADTLRLTREIDLFGALRTALNQSPAP